MLVPDTPADATKGAPDPDRGDPGEESGESGGSEYSGPSPRKTEHPDPSHTAAPAGNGTAAQPVLATLDSSGSGSDSDASGSGNGKGKGKGSGGTGSRSWVHGDEHDTARFIQECDARDARSPPPDTYAHPAGAKNAWWCRRCLGCCKRVLQAGAACGPAVTRVCCSCLLLV